LVRIFLTQLAIKKPLSFALHSTFVFALPGETKPTKYHFLFNAIWLFN